MKVGLSFKPIEIRIILDNAKIEGECCELLIEMH